MSHYQHRYSNQYPWLPENANGRLDYGITKGVKKGLEDGN